MRFAFPGAHQFAARPVLAKRLHIAELPKAADPVQSNQIDHTVFADISMPVNFGKVLRVERYHDNTRKGTVQIADPPANRQQPFFGNASDDRLADVNFVTGAHLMNPEKFAVSEIFAAALDKTRGQIAVLIQINQIHKHARIGDLRGGIVGHIDAVAALNDLAAQRPGNLIGTRDALIDVGFESHCEAVVTTLHGLNRALALVIDMDHGAQPYERDQHKCENKNNGDE